MLFSGSVSEYSLESRCARREVGCEEARERRGARRPRLLAAVWAGPALLFIMSACGSGSREAARLDARSSVEFKERFHRGLDLYRQGLAEGALAELKRCLEINPDDADLEFQVGRILVERALEKHARLDVAASRLEYALRLEPGHIPARRLLAGLYARRSEPGTYDPRRAAELYEGLLAQNPDWEDLRTEYAKARAEGIFR